MTNQLLLCVCCYLRYKPGHPSSAYLFHNKTCLLKSCVHSKPENKFIFSIVRRLPISCIIFFSVLQYLHIYWLNRKQTRGHEFPQHGTIMNVVNKSTHSFKSNANRSYFKNYIKESLLLHSIMTLQWSRSLYWANTAFRRLKPCWAGCGLLAATTLTEQRVWIRFRKGVDRNFKGSDASDPSGHFLFCGNDAACWDLEGNMIVVDCLDTSINLRATLTFASRSTCMLQLTLLNPLVKDQIKPINTYTRYNFWKYSNSR